MPLAYDKLWTIEEDRGADLPFLVRKGEEIVCRVKRREDAQAYCSRRSGMLREAGRRAADLRRHEVELRQLHTDVQLLIHGLETVAKVLRLLRPREILRAREEIRRLLVKVKARGYTR